MKNYHFLSPFQKYIRAESFSGILLFFVTIIALAWSNSPFRYLYDALWQYEIGIESAQFTLVKPLILWINDGLMTVFFFLIGLEIKRELVIGELNSLKKASLPIFAAFGGMIVPMLFFLILNTNPATSKGWGIPMATDIAFTLAVLKLLGKRLPLSLKIFLTAFAIIDDIGAVIVIALFYTGEISWILLLFAGLMLAFLYVLSFYKIHSKFFLLGFGVLIWYLFLKAGIHPTIAGILIAFAVPLSQRINEFIYAEKLSEITKKLTKSTNTNKLPVLTKNQIEEIDHLQEWTERVQSPLQQINHRLHKWVAFLIMPVFALSNAGVSLSSDMDVDLPLIFTIAVSLFAGKAIGVALFSYLSVKAKIAVLPQYVNFRQIIGIAVLSGVGFTMSLFIGGLAFYGNTHYLDSAKIGIISGSLVSGIAGFLILRIGIKKSGTVSNRL